MKVVSLEPGARRDACLARLCAAVHGTQAGLAPLVAFSGTRHLLFPAEAARLWALLDNKGRPLALALLVMDESGEGMAVTLAATLEESREPLRRLLRDLALNAPRWQSRARPGGLEGGECHPAAVISPRPPGSA